jgi:hypothetical protein
MYLHMPVKMYMDLNISSTGKAKPETKVHLYTSASLSCGYLALALTVADYCGAPCWNFEIIGVDNLRIMRRKWIENDCSNQECII